MGYSQVSDCESCRMTMKRQKAVTLIELLIVVGIFLITAAILAPFARMAKVHYGRINCASNLRKISLGLHTYAADHNDTFPQKLGELYPAYVDNETVFDCPAAKRAGTKDDPDYDYAAGLTEASNPKDIIVQDLDGNHKRSGKNLLRVNGAVEWVGVRKV